MGRPCVQVLFCILRRNASSGLKASGICLKGGNRLRLCRLIVRGINTVQLDNMPALQPVLPVQPGIPGRILLRYKIFSGEIIFICLYRDENAWECPSFIKYVNPLSVL